MPTYPTSKYFFAFLYTPCAVMTYVLPVPQWPVPFPSILMPMRPPHIYHPGTELMSMTSASSHSVSAPMPPSLRKYLILTLFFTT